MGRCVAYPIRAHGDRFRQATQADDNASFRVSLNDAQDVLGGPVPIDPPVILCSERFMKG
jgi:hypothetical protein